MIASSYVLLAILAILVVFTFRSRFTASLKDAGSAVAASSSQGARPCPAQRAPNLILSAVDGPKLEDQIFIFMQSLEVALGKDALYSAEKNQHNGSAPMAACPSTAVVVKIIIPRDLAQNLPPGFRTLMKSYPFLSFVGALPDSDTVPVVLRRFQGFNSILSSSSHNYSNVLLSDLDVVFQQNPFELSDSMPAGTEVLYFAEWRGLKIGQCAIHIRWFEACSTEPGWPYISAEQIESYRSLERICAGTTYGTSRSIALYLQTMTEELTKSRYKCNDQAVHIHMFYSGLLDEKLSQAGFGRVKLVPNAEALLGTVGTTPMVRFNHWGEVLNENGDVQVAVHQYKWHSTLLKLVLKKYGWIRELESTSPVLLEVPGLKEDTQWLREVRERNGWNGGGELLLRYRVGDATKADCDEERKLCSCSVRSPDCQMDYTVFE